MAKLTPCVVSLLALLVAGGPNVASAQNDKPDVLHACVFKDHRDGAVHGYIRIVLPSELCRRFEARFLLNTGAPSGDPGEYGAIHGQVLSCLVQGPAAGSTAAVAGQQGLVVYTDGTGEFNLTHVPPGTHALVLGVPGIGEVVIVSDIEVSAGKTTEVDPTTVCYQE